MEIIDELNRVLEYLSSNGSNEANDAWSILSNAIDKLTPQFDRGDIVVLDDSEDPDEEQRRITHCVFEIMLNEVRYWVEGIDEQNFSCDELRLIRKGTN